MTTIATDGKTLAADRQISQDNINAGEICKIHRLKDGSVFGVAGSPFDVAEFERWYNDGAKSGELSMEDGSEALHLSNGRVTVYSDKGKSFSPDTWFQAIGSGAQLALAAMYAGASPKDAVIIATHIDIYSSEPVDELKP